MLRFGIFELDLSAGELYKGGRKVKLQEQPFQILVALLERPGQVVGREQLRRRLWPEDVFVDFEHGLNAAVGKLREALGDSAESPRFVETLARRGYRFIYPLANRAEAETPAVAPSAPDPQTGTHASLRRTGLVLLGVAALVAAATYLMVRRFQPATNEAGRKIMLAVLPFDNLSGDPEQEYLSDGMTEEMIVELGRLQPERLGVIARTSAMTYKGAAKSVEQIGRELGVDYVLEGSVRRAADRVRITAKLIQVRDQTQAWSGSYERPLRDVLALQSDVAQPIAREIHLRLSAGQQDRVTQARPVHPEAYEAYLKGRFFANQWRVETLQRAVELYQQAIGLDPTYAPAHARLAEAYYGLSNIHLPPRQAMPLARSAAAQAVLQNPGLAEGHTMLAMVRFVYDWDSAAAERGFTRAIELDPSSATAHQWYGWALAHLGRREEALAELRRAQRLDPISFSLLLDLAWSLYLTRGYDAAAAHYREMIELAPDFPLAHLFLGIVHEHQGRLAQAVRELERAHTLEATPWSIGLLGRARALAGDSDAARRALAELEEMRVRSYVSPYVFTLLHLALQEKDPALDWLEKAYRDRTEDVILLAVDPRLDPLRGDPRFADLLRRIGLPPSASG